MKNKKLLRIILSALLLLGAYLVEAYAHLTTWQLLLVYLLPYLLAGYDVLGEAWEGIVEGDPFDEDLLMAVATIGALGIGFLPGAESQYPEAVFVMLFFQVGELFEDYAEDRSRASIASLMNLRPDTAHVLRNGQLQTVSPYDLVPGDLVTVRPGEKIPVDGTVTEGSSSLNTVALTGESAPRDIAAGDAVLAGCVNLSGVIGLRVDKAFGESTAAHILRLVEEAGDHKSRGETFISRFAHVYTPIVVIGALLLAVVPPFFASSYVTAFSIWLYRALTFLVVSCPCALVISVPLTFFAGIGGASVRGILIKGGNYMDVLAQLRTVVFDKTGTLTKGVFEVEAVHPDRIDRQELLHLAARVERFSTHPIAQSLLQACPEAAQENDIQQVEEVPGQGVRAIVDQRVVCVGNERLMQAVGAQWRPCHRVGTIVHVAIDGVYAGHIVISDRVKDDAAKAIELLRQRGIHHTVMLSGDHEAVVADMAHRLGIDEYHAQLLPADKVKEVERLLAAQPHGEMLAFVGDGINDAPVLARADVGIAMGGLGADAAIEAADVVLMNDRPSQLALAIDIARRTIGIARQNVGFAIGVKVTVLLLAAIGLVGMSWAVFADVGVMVLAVLNAMRALHSGR